MDLLYIVALFVGLPVLGVGFYRVTGGEDDPRMGYWGYWFAGLGAVVLLFLVYCVYLIIKRAAT